MAKPLEANRVTLKDNLLSLKHIPALLSLLWTSAPLPLTGTIILRLLRSIMPGLLLWIPKQIVDRIITSSQTTHSSRSIIGLLLLELTLATLNDALLQGCLLLDSILGERLTSTVAIRLITHVADLDLAVFEDSSFYDRLERVRGQATGRVYLLTSIMNTFQEIFTLASLIAGLALLSPWLLVLLFVSMIPASAGEMRYTKLSYSMFFNRTSQRRELEYLRLLGSWADSAKEMRVFRLAPEISRRYRVLSERISKENQSHLLRRSLAGAALGLLSTFGCYAGYTYAALEAVSGYISIGTFTFLTGSLLRARGCAERISGNINGASEQALLLGELFSIFEMKPLIASPPNALKVPAVLHKGIEFCNVSFTYPGAVAPSLREVSFCVGPGECLALLGDNGAGKSTIVRLLSRLYDPTEGSVLLEGIDIRLYDLEQLRSMISVLFQDFMRYDLTVRDNIGFGDVARSSDESRLRCAAELAGADTLIGRYGDGYDQLLGKRYKHGVDLSGGEWQKIALSRAFMSDAQLLILDEPTSSLDTFAEARFISTFLENRTQLMSIIVTHRASMTSLATRILMLERGTIAEYGTHDELLQRNGRYAQLLLITKQLNVRMAS